MQLCFLDVIDQRPHHLAHQRVVEVIALVFERPLEFLQGVVMQIVGNADHSRLLTPFHFQLVDPGEKVGGLAHLSGRKLGEQDVPLLADRPLRRGDRSFHISPPGAELTGWPA